MQGEWKKYCVDQSECIYPDLKDKYNCLVLEPNLLVFQGQKYEEPT